MSELMHERAIRIAKENGHTPGHIFSNNFMFCTTCHACLTYNAVDNRGYFIAGTYSGSCQ
jgi:hypothetical protein